VVLEFIRKNLPEDLAAVDILVEEMVVEGFRKA
jgi:hypothetical protein